MLLAGGANMDAKTYLKVSIINLAFLLVGVLIGATVVSFMFFTGTAHAQGPPAKMDTKAAAASPLCDSSRFECLSPDMTARVIGINQLLANQIAADQIMVQGIDLIKVHENTLNLLKLKGIASLAEIQKVIDDARVQKPLRLRPQAQ
jgi:hypothetical protein